MLGSISSVFPVLLDVRADLGCSELVPHQRVCGEGEYGDENRRRGPEVHTHGIQVLPTLNIASTVK